MDARPDTHLVHRALLEPPRYFGLPVEILLLEAAVVLLIGLILPWSTLTLPLLAAWLFVAHPLALWLTREDLLIVTLWARSLRYQGHYDPTARALGARSLQLQPSLPPMP